MHPIRQNNRQPNVQENNLSPVEKAYRTDRKIIEDADLRRFIEKNEAILKLKLKSTSTPSFAVYLAKFFFTDQEFEIFF